MNPQPLVAAALFMALGCLQSAKGDDMLCGGWSAVPITNAKVAAAARCAVQAQNAKAEHGATNAVSLIRITAARQQVVAGLNVAVSLDVKHGQKDRQADAVVWHKLSGEYELTSWKWIPVAQ